MLKIFIVCLLAGLGAGLSTGFAGLSAAVYVTPMLVTFLDVPVYDAVGVALASDVLASAISAVTYKRSGNLDVKHSKLLLFVTIAFTIAGSAVAYIISSNDAGSTFLGYWSIVASLGLGLWFIARPGSKQKSDNKKYSGFRRFMIIACGIYIGFICGFQGTGGGMMLLITLTEVMLFDFKSAVGTSVFIMTFLALIGAIAHFAVNGLPDWTILGMCVVSTTIFARTGAAIANHVSPKTLKRITGAMLALSGIAMLAVKLNGIQV